MKARAAAIAASQIVLLTTALVTGCLCSHKTGQEPCGPVPISTFGLWLCFPNMCARVDESDRQVQISYWYRGSSFAVTNVQTSVDWIVREGWFILPQDPHHVWIYTGAKLHLLQLDREGNSACYSGQFPVQVPRAVKQEILRKAGVL